MGQPRPAPPRRHLPLRPPRRRAAARLRRVRGRGQPARRDPRAAARLRGGDPRRRHPVRLGASPRARAGPRAPRRQARRTSCSPRTGSPRSPTSASPAPAPSASARRSPAAGRPHDDRRGRGRGHAGLPLPRAGRGRSLSAAAPTCGASASRSSRCSWAGGPGSSASPPRSCSRAYRADGARLRRPPGHAGGRGGAARAVLPRDARGAPPRPRRGGRGSAGRVGGRSPGGPTRGASRRAAEARPTRSTTARSRSSTSAAAAEAATLWRRALEAEAQHVEATYNAGLAGWAEGPGVRLGAAPQRRGVVRLARGNGPRPAAPGPRAPRARPGGGGARRLRARERTRRHRGPRARPWPRRGPGAPPPLRTLRGLSGPVAALALSPDGRTIVAGGGRELRQWETGTGSPAPHSRPPPRGRCAPSPLLPDGRFVVVSVENAPLTLWDLVSGRSERPWARHAGFDTCLALLPGARFLVSGGSDRVVRLWDPSTGRVVREMTGHTDAVTAVAAGETRIASASRDGTVRIWALEDGRCLGTLRGHEGRVLAVAIDEAQARVVSGRRRRHRARLGPRVPRARARLPLPRAAGLGRRPLAGRRAASSRPPPTARCGAFETDGERLVALARLGGCGERARRGSRRQRLGGPRDDGRRPRVEAPAPARPGPLPPGLGVGGGGPRLVPSRPRLADARRSLGAGDLATAVSFARNARSVPGHERSEAALAVWDDVCRPPAAPGAAVGVGGRPPRGPRRPGARRRRRRHGLARAHRGPRRDAAPLGPAGPPPRGHARRPRGGGDGRRLRRRRPRPLGGARPDGAAVEPGVARAPSPCSRATARRWPRSTPPRTGPAGRARAGTGRSGSGTCAGARPAASSKGTGRRSQPSGSLPTARWSRAPGGTARRGCGTRSRERRWRVLAGHEGNVTALALHADGRRVATGGAGRHGALWDPRTRQAERVLTGHEAEVTDLCFTPDGRFLLSASRDRTVRVWDLRQGTCARTLPHPALVLGLALTPLGSTLVTACADRTAHLWHLDWEPDTTPPPVARLPPGRLPDGTRWRRNRPHPSRHGGPRRGADAPRGPPSDRAGLRPGGPAPGRHAARRIPWRRVAIGACVLIAAAIAWRTCRRPRAEVRLSPLHGRGAPEGGRPHRPRRVPPRLRTGRLRAPPRRGASRQALGRATWPAWPSGAARASWRSCSTRRPSPPPTRSPPVAMLRNAASALSGLSGTPSPSRAGASRTSARRPATPCRWPSASSTTRPRTRACARRSPAAPPSPRPRRRPPCASASPAASSRSTRPGPSPGASSAARSRRRASPACVSWTVFAADVAEPVVRPLQDDADPDVAEAAREALEAIDRIRRTDEARDGG